jgi:uncharacterized BrkB/YihY/UPF0761 family membrane protein
MHDRDIDDHLDDGAEQKPSAVKRSTEAVKARAQFVRDDLERRRGQVWALDIAFRGAEHDVRSGGGILAGALAFRFFLFVVPYVFVVVFAFGIGASAAHTDPVELARRSGIVGLAASAIDASSEVSTFAQIATMTLALWALLSGARTLLKALYTVHCLVWGIPLVRVRHLMLKALMAIGLMTLVFVFVRLIAAIQHESLALWIVAMAATVAVPAAGWLLVTDRVLPSAPDTTWRDLWPGAALFGVGVQGLHVITIVWIARSLESKSETYGALGAALTILLWAYLLGRLVTAAASLNAVIWADKRRASVPAG